MLTDINCLFVRQFIDNFLGTGVVSEFLRLSDVIVAHVALLLLDVLDDVHVILSGESQSFLNQQIQQMLSDVIPTKVNTLVSKYDCFFNDRPHPI